MKTFFIFYLMSCLLFCTTYVEAQTSSATISGTVSGGNPLETLSGVSVMLKGTKIGTVTGSAGQYELSVPNSEGSLIFSYIGYEVLEVEINQRTTINANLHTSGNALEELVVVGYGTQKRKDLTGSIASVSAEDIKNQPASNIESLLQGRAAGVQINQSSGAPGSNLSVRIRGGSSINAGNEPLYVIDGIPLMNDNQDPSGTSYGTASSTNALTSLNPDDIESMQILKDASATAIYGSRGNNGVIIITTKRGKSDDLQVAYNGYYGNQRVIKKLDLMNGEQHAEFLNDWAQANKLTKPFANPAEIGQGTDWQDKILRSAPIQNHQVSVSSGKNDVKYYVSANFFDQLGVIRNSGLSRYSLRVNLDGKITDKIKFSQAFTFNRTVSNSLPASNQGAGNVRSAAERSWVTSPTIPVYDENGEYTATWYGANKPDNPVAALSSIYNELTGDNVLGNVSIDYEIIDGLTFKALAGVNLNNRALGEYYPGSTTYIGSLFSGLGINSNRRITNILNENTLRYTKTFNQTHNLEVLAGYTWQAETDFENSAQASGFADDRLGIYKLGGGTGIPMVDSYESKWGLSSVLSRINYQYNNKLLLTASFRADGSSRFGEGNKWGYFPSIALGYRLIEEEFIKKLNLFSDLKIRGSYGLTGNQEIGSYQSLPRLATDLFYVIGNKLVSGSRQTSLPNAELKWEKASQYDFGLEVALFENRLSLEFDYYKKTTQDLLFTINLPGTSGYSTALYNTGAVENKGIELTLNGEILTKELKWDASFNFSRNRNKLTSLGRNASTSLFVGYPLGMILGYVYDGVFNSQQEIMDQSVQKGVQPGDARYQDVNGDGQLNTDDRILIGNAFPDYIIGLNNSLRYKGLSLSMFVQGSIGGESTRLNDLFNPAEVSSNKSVALLDRWSPQNSSSSIPRAGVSNWLGPSTHDLQDLTYLKLRNVQLGYTLPKRWLPTIGSAHIYLSGQNLVTLTNNYSGYDPDGGMNYPTAKTIMLGINLTF